MIQNEREYKISKSELEKFKAALDQLEQQTDIPVWQIRLQKNAMQSSVEELEQQILEFEGLKNSQMPVRLTLHELEDLPKTLIQARIAKGWTQAQLAEQMGVKPQQVQNDEISQYQSASFVRLTKVARVLGVKLEETKVLVG